eukprot:6174941-Pleurochrysis_carterae.AAC.1
MVATCGVVARQQEAIQKVTSLYTAEYVLTYLSLVVPTIAYEAGQTILKCPKSVPKQAITSPR